MKTHTDVTARDLDRVFFAPYYEDLRPLFVEAYHSFDYGSDANYINIVMRIISNYHSKWRAESNLANSSRLRKEGDFNMKSMLEHSEMFCQKIRLADFFSHPRGYGFYSMNDDICYGKPIRYESVTCSHEDKDVFAVAVGSEVIHTRDNDTQVTAGCYRTYESDENPIVYLANSFYGIILKVKSSCMIDHYNNNFFGNSTGGGTTRYKKGESISTRIINTRCFDLRKVLSDYKLELKKMDCERGKAFYSDYYLSK